MLTSIITIAKNTVKETIRDKILLAALFVSIGIILFSLFIASISLDQSTRMIVDFSTTAIYVLQMFVAIFIGSMLMYREIERKTFYLLIPKPITRTAIIIGKALGLTITTSLVTALSVLTLSLVLLTQGGSVFIFPILIAFILSTFEALIIILLSMFFSGLTSPIIAAITTIIFFLVGHSSEIFRYIFMTTDSTTIEFIVRAIYYLLPNLDKFNIRNEIMYNTLPSATMLTLTVIYALMYALLLLVVTRFAFKRRDF